MHHTKDKGDLGVFKVMTDLQQKGFIVCYPLTEHAPFDLVAYRNNVFIKVQVKHRKIVDGAIAILKRTSWADRHGTHHKAYTRENVDVFAIFCPEKDCCYYIRFDAFGKSLILRVTPAKNSQKKNVRNAEDYLNLE